MSSALTVIVLGSAFFGNFSLPNISPPQNNCTEVLGSIHVPSTTEIPNTTELTEESTTSIADPEARRPDYTYTPGVGAHKSIAEMADWNEARQKCEEDGAHLVIINSVAEAELVLRLVDRVQPNYSHVGVHRLDEEGEFVTIHGEPLIQTGFAEWGAGEPNNPDMNWPENCVQLHTDAKLHNIPCDYWILNKFVCELPLTAF